MFIIHGRKRDYIAMTQEEKKAWDKIQEDSKVLDQIFNRRPSLFNNFGERTEPLHVPFPRLKKDDESPGPFSGSRS